MYVLLLIAVLMLAWVGATLLIDAVVRRRDRRYDPDRTTVALSVPLFGRRSAGYRASSPAH